MTSLNKGPVRISYPCQWLYKVIGCDREKMHRALLAIIGEGACQISLSRTSGSGRYHCLNLEVTVRSEEERNSLYTAIKAHPEVRLVL